MGLEIDAKTGDLVQVNNIWLPASDTHFRETVEKTGNYLIERLWAGMSYCPTKHVAIDIGAHVGLWTRVMIEQFTEVYAFEPDPTNYACLVKNVAAVPGTVHLHNVAVGRSHGRGRMLADPLPKRQGNTGARFMQSGLNGPVLVATLDELNLSHCDFIKIDVEGAELDVLIGAYATILRCRPVIMLEVGKTPPERFGHTAEEPMRYLEKMGMKLELEMRADKVFMWTIPTL